MEIKTSSFFWDSSISSYSLFRRRSEFSINPYSYSSSSMRTLHSLFIIILDLVSSNLNVCLQLEELRGYQLQQQQQEQLNISIIIFAYIYSCLKGEKMRKQKKIETHKEKIYFLDFIICDYSVTSKKCCYYFF